MPVDYKFKKGVDTPTWVWMTQSPVSALVSGGLKYDGNRYLYSWNSASLYRFDTWTNGWQFLVTPGVGVAGQDLVWDPTRNVLISTVTATTWQVFNLNNVAVTIAGVVCNPWALTTMTPILPVTLATGAGLSLPRNVAPGETIRTGVVADAAGQTATNVRSVSNMSYAQMVGLTLRVTSGLQAGQARTISAAGTSTDITLAVALPGALAGGDTFDIEYPNGTATAGAVGTLTDGNQAWIVNKYSNWDVEIVSGTGVGQRRRIASNTATVLTLAAAVAGNPRTGNWTTAPDATSVYRIIPSNDFLYYITGATFYKLDIVATPAAAWTLLTAPPAGHLAGGSLDFNRKTAPGHLFSTRGGTATIQVYDIGLNNWTTLTHFGLGPTIIFSTGASSILLDGLGKLLAVDEATTQLFLLDLPTLMWDVFGNHPYIAGTAVEGKRMEEVITADGVRFIYLLRTGGQEFFRVPIEWL